MRLYRDPKQRPWVVRPSFASLLACPCIEEDNYGRKDELVGILQSNAEVRFVEMDKILQYVLSIRSKNGVSYVHVGYKVPEGIPTTNPIPLVVRR